MLFRGVRLSSRAKRKFSEADVHGEHRTPFERDRDRLLYTEALRRLAGVTQVVRPAEGHVFHNRLTHTHEVAQLARRLAQRISRTADKELLEELGGLDPEVAEAAALAHDLGHPPFGHVAETELDRLIIAALEESSATKKGGMQVAGFEGNAQSFRIVTKLAIRSFDGFGLNLTRATLNGLLKYPWQKSSSAPKRHKYGVYPSEVDFFRWT